MNNGVNPSKTRRARRLARRAEEIREEIRDLYDELNVINNWALQSLPPDYEKEHRDGVAKLKNNFETGNVQFRSAGIRAFELVWEEK